MNKQPIVSNKSKPKRSTQKPALHKPIKPIKPTKSAKPRRPRTPLPINEFKNPLFYRNLLLYFLSLSYLGHYIEMLIILLAHHLLSAPLNTAILANPAEPYMIYGTGAILVLVLIRPLTRKFNHHPLATYAVATLICTLLELTSSLILTLRYGKNPYWDYHQMPLNLGGHICLPNSLLFGLLATIFLRLIYPHTETLLKKPKLQLPINLLLTALSLSFALYYLLPLLGG